MLGEIGEVTLLHSYQSSITVIRTYLLLVATIDARRRVSSSSPYFSRLTLDSG